MPTSYDVYSGDETTLAVKINSTQTTGIKLGAMIINGSSVAVINQGPGVIEILEEIEGSKKREWIYFTTGTVNADNTFTLSDTGLQRDVARNAATLTGSGTGQSFNKGATVRFVDFHFIWNQKANLDRANTFTSTVAFSGSTNPGLTPNRLTTTQRDALVSPTNGTIIYNTTTNRVNSYEGGAWGENGSTTVSDGSTTVAGKFEEATVAEQGTAAATGATGARLVPAVANLVKTSSGASDENKIPVLNASGQLADGYIGSGSPSAANYLLGNRTWGTIAGVGDKFFGTGSGGAPTWTSGASLDATAEFQYTTATIPVSQTVTTSSTNKVLVIHNTGDVTINGTMDLNGRGGAGGALAAGVATGNNGVIGNDGTAGAGIVTALANGAGLAGAAGGQDGSASSGGGGGSGGASQFANSTAGGAGASAPTTPAGGAAATSLSAANQYLLQMILRGVTNGSGGGGGASGGNNSGSGTSGAGGAGGAGGGALVWYIGGNLTLGAASVIRADGVNGSAGGNPTAGGTRRSAGGGGGGGAGGYVLILVGGSITNSGVTLSATAGTGGAAGDSSGTSNSGTAGAGGAGAVGKVLIYSISSGTVISA